MYTILKQGTFKLPFCPELVLMSTNQNHFLTVVLCLLQVSPLLFPYNNHLDIHIRMFYLYFYCISFL